MFFHVFFILIIVCSHCCLAVADHTTMHIKKLVLQQKRNGKVSNIRKPQDESVRRPQPKPDIPAIVRMKIKELLKLHPNGVNGSMFGSVFAKRFGRELNFQKYGYSTLKKFFEDCSDIVQMDTQEKDGKKSTILTLKKNVKNSPVKACVVSPNSQEKIEEETNNRNSVAPSVQRSSISSALQPSKIKVLFLSDVSINAESKKFPSLKVLPY